jgi:hypothetical protein
VANGETALGRAGQLEQEPVAVAARAAMKETLDNGDHGGGRAPLTQSVTIEARYDGLELLDPIRELNSTGDPVERPVDDVERAVADARAGIDGYESPVRALSAPAAIRRRFRWNPTIKILDHWVRKSAPGDPRSFPVGGRLHPFVPLAGYACLERGRAGPEGQRPREPELARA